MKLKILAITVGISSILAGVILVHADAASTIDVSAATTTAATSTNATSTLPTDLVTVTTDNGTTTASTTNSLSTTSTVTENNQPKILVPVATSTQNYYPNAFPSTWFVLPGETLSFNGKGFAPNETVHIIGGGLSVTATADESGNFTSKQIVIPFSLEGTHPSFSVSGSQSSGASTPNPITIEVGAFYPQINPSDWWVGNNQSITVSGTGFAPNEPVTLSVNGSGGGNQVNADNSGHVSFTITTPSSGTSATLTAQGASSTASVNRTIYLHS
jgi:hypothetical protein